MTDYHGTHSISSPVSRLRLMCVQLWARFGPTFFTWCMAHSSMLPIFPGISWRTHPTKMWETSYFSTSSLTPCFSSHVTLLVSFSTFHGTRLCFSHVDTDMERTVVQARDAWIQAAANRYNATGDCALWDAFASRGLGVNAADFTDDTSVPSGC